MEDNNASAIKHHHATAVTEDVLSDFDTKGDDLISVSTDDALLMSMGKKPELRRVYNFWTCTLVRTS